MASRYALMMVVLLLGAAIAQYQPADGVDAEGLEIRTDRTEAGDMEGAFRVLRFVQFSDAHIVDDDAPVPVRVNPIDAAGSEASAAERPQEEYTDEVLNAVIREINRLHGEDALDFVLNTGDNVDNALENELMRFIDNMDGTYTGVGPISDRICAADGQSTSVDDDSQDVTDQCTSLPESFRTENTPLADGLPWFTAFGNHDALIQGNMPMKPSFAELANESGRQFLTQSQFIDMHFGAGQKCVSGDSGGQATDDYGHGFSFAGATRLCDTNPDNDGYYAFGLNGVRFVVLDTVNDDFLAANGETSFLPGEEDLGYDVAGGLSYGAIDPDQWEWLLGQIDSNPDDIIIVVSHHTVNTMWSEQTAPACAGDVCVTDLLQEAGYLTSQQIVSRLAEEPNVVAWLGGHSHYNLIEPKTQGSGGFWNIETSSLIDSPQEFRVLELWAQPDGKKAFLTSRLVQHNYTDSIDLAKTDDQFDQESGIGTTADREVLLWFDVPPSVEFLPQPSTARYLIPTLTTSKINDTNYVGMEVTLTANVLENRFFQPVPGLNVTISISHFGEEGEVVDADMAPMAELGGGAYEYHFTPPEGATYRVVTQYADDSGFYPTRSIVSAFFVEDVRDPVEVENTTSKKSPGIGLLALVGIVVLALARRR